MKLMDVPQTLSRAFIRIEPNYGAPVAVAFLEHNMVETLSQTGNKLEQFRGEVFHITRRYHVRDAPFSMGDRNANLQSHLNPCNELLEAIDSSFHLYSP